LYNIPHTNHNKKNNNNYNVLKPQLNTKFRDLSLCISCASAGEYHSIVVDDDGKVWSFGKGGGFGNSYGALGTSTSLTALVDDYRYVSILFL
jgi:alpha-tubulin suppressor-like RCC1 family protein